MSQAAAAWQQLFDRGRIEDDAALPAFLGIVLDLEHVFADGSRLRWSRRRARWQFYDDLAALDAARLKGEA